MPPREISPCSPPLADHVDEAFDLYTAWREDAAHAAAAYRRWASAAEDEKRRRFAAYHAAVDQEEASAGDYAHAVCELEQAAWRLGVPVPPASAAELV